MKSNVMNRTNKERGCLSQSETFNFLSKYYNLRETTMSVEIVRSCNLRCPGCWVNFSHGLSTASVIINNLRKAVLYSKEYGFTVTVNHTIFPANFHDTEAMIRFVASIGVKRCRLHFTFPGDEERNAAVKDASTHNQDRGTYIMPEDWLGLFDRCRTLSGELGIEIQSARVYGHSEVVKTAVIKAPYLNVLPNGELLMCPTHSRLSNKERHNFATIADERRIKLNENCILFKSPSKSTCCKAISELIKQLPGYMRERINRVGMGCFFLPSPLA
ncbi:MAG: hypothetical protein ACUZ8N_08220 [Candidatus Scalindua sp.]